MLSMLIDRPILYVAVCSKVGIYEIYGVCMYEASKY